MNKLKKQLYKFKDNFSWTCAPMQSSRTSRFTIQTVEPNSCKVEVNRRTATYIGCLHLISNNFTYRRSPMA